MLKEYLFLEMSEFWSLMVIQSSDQAFRDFRKIWRINQDIDVAYHKFKEETRKCTSPKIQNQPQMIPLSFHTF